jgi:sterol desaturase/sphingolipid hydroxylase (fatty acid hydroxylase superfamily)
VRDLTWPVAAVAALGVALFALERRFPLRRESAALIPRLLVNVAFSAAAYGAAALLVRPVVLAFLGRPGLGVAALLPFPGWARGAAAFLLLDLSFYWWHRANHRLPWLWRFHNVHHLDPDLDLSTALRFHFGEVALSSLFRVAQIALVGPGVVAFAVYELCFQANTLFHHSNTRLPIQLERALNRVLVTPRMHGIHHSQVEAEASSNYSVVLPWWDRLHRTLRLNVPQAQITVGVPAYAHPEDNRLLALLAHPFRRQRDYWRRADGGPIERPPLDGPPDRLAP